VIVDVDAELDESGVMAAAQAAGFAVDDAQLVVRGLCADCRQRD
jgi:Fe2+ or Zn2+ uptake regulation protein